MTAAPGPTASPESTASTTPDGPESGKSRAPRLLAPWFVGLGILLFSASLRSPIVGVSPLLETIREDSGFSAAVAGLLTTIPVLCFGLVSPWAPWLGRRFGIERVIFGALIALLLGVLLRLLPSVAALFIGTFVIGAAIAIGNVLLPGLIKRDFPHRVGLMTGLYTMTLSAGAAVAAATVVPLVQATGWGWRGVLAIVAIPIVIAIIVWLPQTRFRHPAQGGGLSGVVRMLHSPLAWYVTLFLGLQSLNYYALTAWLPAIFVNAGTSASAAGWLLGLGNLAGILGSFVTPIIAERARSQVGIGILSAALVGGSLVGLLVAPEPLGVLWVLVLGFAQGMSLSIALLIIVLRTRTVTGASDLSGMAQSIGYLLAAVGPIAMGALHDATGSWATPLIALLVILAGQLVFGILAGRDRAVAGA